MQPAQLKGTLVRWNDDRGFGFIAPDAGGSHIFLHIHAIRNASRRPQIGDTLLFGIETQADGRMRATNAFIQGYPYFLPLLRPATLRTGSLGMLGFQRG